MTIESTYTIIDVEKQNWTGQRKVGGIPDGVIAIRRDGEGIVVDGEELWELDDEMAVRTAGNAFPMTRDGTPGSHHSFGGPRAPINFHFQFAGISLE